VNEGAGPKARRMRPETRTRGSAFGLALAAALALFFAAPRAGAQTTPSFSAAAAYNMQPGTVPIGVATGVFNISSGGLLDFAILEQVPNSTSYQVEIFHGQSNGSFCTNCGNANPNPDLIPLGSGVKGNAIAVGQFRSGGPLDIAVATHGGIVFLQNNDTGTFTLSSNAISSTNGFATLAVGLFNGDGNPDIAAVTPTVSGSVSFTVFFGDGTGAFPTQSPYAVSNTWAQCTQIMSGNFQSQTSGSDLALLCNNPSEAGVLVYLNSGSGGGYTYNYSSTPYSAGAFGGVLPSAAVGTLNGLGTIFVSSVSNSFATYQSNGSGVFTAVSMIPVGLAPHGTLAILYNSSTAIDFASGPSVSTFTSYAQSGTSVNGTWNSTANLGPAGQTLAAGSSNLTQGATYVVVDAGTHSGDYANPNVSGPPNFEPYVDERSIGVYLVTLNGDGTVASTNTAPVFPGAGLNGYAAPPVFATGDFNGDGAMDLAVGGANDGTGDATITIYLANSEGSLPVPPTPVVPAIDVANTFYSGTDAVVAGKFRSAQGGKTLYDLAVFSFGQIAIFTSNGDGSFNAGGTYSLTGDPNYPGFRYNPSGGNPFAPVLTATDVNGDGYDDIVLTLPEDDCKGSGSASQGAVYILLSNGDGTFQSPVFAAPPVENPVSATAAKFFGSTLSDLVFANGGELCSGNTATTTATAVGILRNQVTPGAATISAGNFTAGVILTQTPDPGVPNVTAVASGDFNGDGHPDLVVSSTNGIQVLLNSGTGSFSPTAQGVVPLYAGDVVPGPLCSNADNYVGCVTYDSQLATGSFFASGETDVAAAINGVVYIFQNNSGTLTSPRQGFAAGSSSGMISGALAGSNGLNGLLVATTQGTAYLSNSGTGSTSGPSVATYSTGGPIVFVTNVTSTATQQLILTNTGGTAFAISGISTSEINPAFSVSNVVCNGATDFPFASSVNLGPGQSCTITVQFAPTAYGNGQADLLTVLDTASSSNASASPQNNGQSFLLAGDATAPFASLSPTALNFGNVNENAIATLPVTLTNTGNGPLTLTFVFVTLLGPNNTGFVPASVVCNGAAAQYPVTLNPSQLCTVMVQFDPTAPTSFATNLYFEDNAGVGESNLTSTLTGSVYLQALPLAGLGIGPAIVPDNETITVTDSDTITPLINVIAPVAGYSAGSLGFGGADGSQTLTVSDIGLASLTMDSATISPGSPFAISGIACSNTATSFSTALPSGGACILTITYTGSSPGTDTGTLTFTDNAALSNLTSTASGSNFTQSITLNGSGGSTAPPPAPPATVDVPTSGPDSEIITVTDTPVVKVFYTPTVQLTISPGGPVVDGQPVTLTAQVVSSAGGPGTPTGTVTFLNGTTTLGTGPITLSQGLAVLTTSTLPSGYNGITASYGGDSNFAAETSPVETVSVNAADYTVIAVPSTLTIAAGQSASTTITVTPEGFGGSVTFSCGNLPSYITCTFNPSNGSLSFPFFSTTPQTMTLTVSVASTIIGKIEQSKPFLMAMVAPLGLLGLLPIIGKKRKRLRMYLVLAAMLTMGAAIAGCSGGGSTPSGGATTTPPAGTQSFVVTAAGSSSSGNVSHQLQLTIIITN
jgi:hypothetical protein